MLMLTLTLTLMLSHVIQISKLESVLWRFTKRIAGLRNMPYVERLKKLQLESLETRRLHNDLLFT